MTTGHPAKERETFMPAWSNRAGRLSHGGAILLIAAFPAAGLAQEALRNSLAGSARSEPPGNQVETMPYNFKWHDAELSLNPAVSLEWNDNINLAQDGAQQDFIFSPTLRTAARIPVSKQNELQLNVGAGYNKYFAHNEYDAWFLESGTELSFDVYVKDFWMNLHDRVRYMRGSDEPGQQAQVANTAQFDTINNLAGVNGAWNLNDVVLEAGYDHENVISSTEAFNHLDNETELLFSRVDLNLPGKIVAGPEATVTVTSYEQPVFNNNIGYSAGLYARWRPGTYFQVSGRAGYCTYQFQNTSQTVRTSDLDSWYLGINLNHNLTKAASYYLEAGHEISLGVQADAVEDWYVRPGMHWNVLQDVSLNCFIFYEHGRQGAGNISGNLAEDFDWLGTGFGADYSITKNLTVTLGYRLVLRSSDAAARSYDQNLLRLELSYHPQ